MTLSCPITPIGTEKRANLATDAPAETVAAREVATAELQVAFWGLSDAPSLVALAFLTVNNFEEG